MPKWLEARLRRFRAKNSFRFEMEKTKSGGTPQGSAVEAAMIG
jgi:hypothetical protein